MKVIMSRRKQLNPKPLIKRDDEDFSEETAANQANDNDNLIAEATVTVDGADAEEDQQTKSPDMKSSSRTESPQLSEDGDEKKMTSPNESPMTSRTSRTSPNLEESLNNHQNESLDRIISRSPASSCTSESNHIGDLKFPTLRLNTKLASDPALQPEAKDLKTVMKSQKNTEDISEGPSLISNKSDTRPTENTLDLPTKIPTVDIPPRIPVFLCGPCGIRFSSKSTLEAHQTYYCSHRKDADEPNSTPGAGKHALSTSEPSSSGTATGLEPPAKSIRTGKQYACSQCSYSADKKVSLNRHMRMHQTSPAPSSTASNGDITEHQAQFLGQGLPIPNHIAQVDRYCSDCDIRFNSTKTYRAHKQHYCSSRHRESSSQIQSATTTPKSSVVKSGSTSPPEAATSPVVTVPPAYLALPTNPIIIVPCSVIRAATILPGPLSAMSPNVQKPESTCFILQNNSLTPIAQSLAVTSLGQTSDNPQSKASPNGEEESAPKIVKPNISITEVLRDINKSDLTIPLDLSIRRLSSRVVRERSLSLSSAVSGDPNTPMDLELMLEGKENLSTGGSNSATPEQIVCAPSLPGSPPLTPSPKRRSNSPRISNLSPTSQHAAIIRNIPPELSIHFPAEHLVKHRMPPLINHQNNIENIKKPQLTPPLMKLPSPNPVMPIIGNVAPSSLPPQIFVKQGVSKCKECNIVFCKYENYVAHKKHYCSARNLEEDPSASKSPPQISPQARSPSAPQLAGQNTTSRSSSGGPVAPLPYQQLICAACGTKFTSLDNLGAHQMYYCSKRVEIAAHQAMVQKEKCSKCKTLHDASQQCPASVLGGYKCPLCDVVSANSAESRRHMETHGGVKAFRCTICNYKGNTLRGMRTHIRMHFEKKAAEFNEENYITCILENEEAMEVVPNVEPQLHSCDVCSYTSTSKANVIKHIKMVHSPSGQRPITPQVEENCRSSPALSNGTSASAKEIPIKINFPSAPNSETSSTFSVSVKIEPNLDGDKSDTESDLVIDEHEPVVKSEAKSEEKNELEPWVGPRQCENCDIKFNYLNTYLAHRQFYCKGNSNSNGPSAGKSNSVGSASERRDSLTTPSPNGLSQAVVSSNRAAEVL